MPRVNFKYDFEKDAWSWVYIIGKKKDTYGYSWKKQVGFAPKHLLEKILKYDRKSAELLVRKYLISNSQRLVRQLAINKQLKALEEVWKKIESKYFKRLEKITQKPIFTKDFGCYLTTGYMCPYNDKENWFMVSIWHNILMDITTICHEIFHLQFLNYYKKYCMKYLSREQTEDLKESLTFMLNTDFNDLIMNNDNGYPDHEKLREKLEKIWCKEKNFKKFLDKAIKITKELRSLKMFKFGQKVNKKVEELVGLLPKNGKVLDLGCGRGGNSIFLAEKGFKVTAVDSDKETINKIKTNCSKINTVNKNISEFDFPEKEYDFVLALNVLSFFKKREINLIIKNILKSLKENGLAYIQVFSTKEPNKKFKYLFSKKELSEFFSNNKILKMEELILKDDHPPQGEHKHGIIRILVRK